MSWRIASKTIRNWPSYFRFDFLQLAGEFGIGAQHLAEADEGAHDGDVHLHGAITAQDAGKHGDTLFGECHGGGSAEFAEARYHIL